MIRSEPIFAGQLRLWDKPSKLAAYMDHVLEAGTNPPANMVTLFFFMTASQMNFCSCSSVACTHLVKQDRVRRLKTGRYGFLPSEVTRTRAVTAKGCVTGAMMLISPTPSSNPPFCGLAWLSRQFPQRHELIKLSRRISSRPTTSGDQTRSSSSMNSMKRRTRFSWRANFMK